jgi:hypothetical protein
VFSLDNQLSNAHDAMQWTGGGFAEKRGRFDQAVGNTIGMEQRRLNRALSEVERQAVIDRMLVSGEVSSGSMFKPDRDRQYYEVAGTPDAAQFVPSIDSIKPGTRTAIENALLKEGTEPTEAAVIERYMKFNPAR